MKILKTRVIQFLLLAVFLLKSLTSQGQTDINTKVSGKIMNSSTEPSSFASVGLFKSTDSVLLKGTLTTEDGNFIIQSIPAGSYYLSASVMGYKKYKSQTFTVDINDNKKLDLIYLVKESYQLNEVVIKSNKPLIENKIDKTVLNIENSVLAAGNTALELLQKAPGVSVDNKQISLRGKSNVLILIDGKATYLSQDQVSDLLSSTQSSTIQSIEIMTNPSSKYDATGNAGIINIKMKKNQAYGTNGTINISAGSGRYRKTNGGIALNQKTAIYNFFALYNYNDNIDFNSLTVDRYTTDMGQSTFFNSSSFAKYQNRAQNFKVGTDFNISNQSTIGFIVSGNLRRSTTTQSSINYIGSQPLKIDSAVVGLNKGKNPNNYLTYNLNYKAILDTSGTELSISTDYSSSRGKENHDFTNQFLDQGLNEYKTPDAFRNYTPSNADIYVAKADFSHPFNKNTKLEAGLKYSAVRTDNNLVFDHLLPNGSYNNDVKRSNHFLYNEDIAAAYVNFNKEFGDYSLQAGLRAEKTNSTGNSLTTANIVKRNYIDLFPTLFIRKKLDDDQTLGIGFGRRVDRPDYASLNPFVYYIDQYTNQYGNPYLSPQYTNSYEINYILKGKYTASLGYRKTSDAITFVLLTDPVTKAISQTNMNLKGYSYYNLNLNAPVTITNWWNTYNNLTLFYNKYNSDEIEGAPLQREKLAYQISTSHTFTVDKQTTVELNANYFSPTVYGVFNLKSYYGVDLGLNRSFFDKKMDIKLAVNDLFNTRGKRTTYGSFPASAYDIHTNYDSRVARISVTYRFGNTKVKSTDKSGTAADEERRLKK
ncbi:outer membrane beta-barrel protein [Pedobacter sp. WC2423]|uniref:outer membrane beta-barrel protein n=1 Tax=Pedobacter sp. WC2423 TaxID=3234142 RepID=UPI0034677CA9